MASTRSFMIGVCRQCGELFDMCSCPARERRRQELETQRDEWRRKSKTKDRRYYGN